MNRLYPVDIMVYEHIKFFTEKGELKCCCQSNSKIGDEIGRHKTNISRSISKLKNLGYIKIEDDNGRKLSTTDKQISVKYSKTPIDNLAMADDNLAMLVDILATPVDNLAMDRLIISLRGVDNLAKHNIEFKLRYLNSHLKEENIKENFDFGLFEKVMNDWLDYKKDRKEKYQSDKSVIACFNKLKKMSNDNPNVAQDIVNQSIANNWAGLFELKKQNNKKTQGSYNNYSGTYGEDIPL